MKTLLLVLVGCGTTHQVMPAGAGLALYNERMAEACYAKGNYDKALKYYQKALAIQLKKLGPNDPDTKEAKGELDALR